MPTFFCGECRKLMDEATAAIKSCLDAGSRLTAAVRSEGADADIDALRRSVREHQVEETEAVRRYENHVASHGVRVMTAG